MGRYRIIDLELSEPLPEIVLGPDEIGYALVARWRDRIVGFRMFPATAAIAGLGKTFFPKCARLNIDGHRYTTGVPIVNAPVVATYP